MTKTKRQRTYDTFGHYISAIRTSCPDPFPDSSADYQGGAWLREGEFFIRDMATLPKRAANPSFWAGRDSVKP